jgi:hypothetical protein
MPRCAADADLTGRVTSAHLGRREVLTMTELRVATLTVVALLFTAIAAHAADPKPVTLTGSVGCAMCVFKVEKDCHTAIKVTEGGKDVVYLFDEAADKKYHAPVCKEAKAGKVTGVVSEKDGKKYVTVASVEYTAEKK